MYDWLSEEINIIKTRRFHLIHLTSIVESEKFVDEASLPPSYLAFIRKFGHSKLYRSGTQYIIHVLDMPQIDLEWDGKLYARFGATAVLTNAYFKVDDLSKGMEASVYELEYWDGEYELEKRHPTFHEWLLNNSETIKSNMSQEGWAEVLNGPISFNEIELRIIKARKEFSFSLLGFTETGDARILVKNQSQMSLPYLTIGVAVQAAEQHMQRCWLPVNDLKPGESRILDVDLYKKFMPRDSIKLFELPDPEPEDRDIFWEFR